MSFLGSSKLAIDLLQERSRDALIAGLVAATEQLGQEEMLGFVADLLLTIGADRDQLKARLTSLLSMQFGRRSEQSSAAQLSLFAEALRAAAAQMPPSSGEPSETSPPTPMKNAATLIEQTNAEIAAEVSAQREKRKAEREERREALQRDRAEDGATRSWPAHLPVRYEYAEVPEAHQHCDVCERDRSIIRHEETWRIEYRTVAEVVVTRLPVVACGSHHGGPLSTPVPPKPVEKGQMGFSLAAHLLWLRVTHNLPVRRIAEMMEAEGVPVTEQMIHTLIEETGERAKPLSEAIHRAVQAAVLVNLDDTPTDVLDGVGQRRRRQARVWLALGDEQFAWFFVTKSWKPAEAERELGPIQGVLQGDGYGGFPGYAAKNGVKLAGCMAHLRRKLRTAVLAKDPRATDAMALVQGLYRVEELARLRNLDAAGRLALRRERSVPIMQALCAWAEAVAPTIETGGPLGKAWTYLRNQWEPLQVFLTDGNVSIDNNAAERSLRRITIGRKLWLFFRDQAKLEHVARLMSIVTTARLHGVDELAYLTWVIEELARREWSPEAAASKLLPDQWRAMQEQQAKEVAA